MQPPRAQVFAYDRPEVDHGKALVRLGRSDLIFSGVQVLRHGGENNLHAHTNMDGFWFVLSGRVRFYTEGDEVVADLHEREGVLIPRGFPYWFESVGGEGAELLQVEALATPSLEDKDLVDGRVDHAPRTSRPRTVAARSGTTAAARQP